MPVPAAIVPMPVSTAAVEPCGSAMTADQSMFTTRKARIARFAAPKIQVDHFWTTRIIACPIPETATVNATNSATPRTAITGADFASPPVPASSETIVITASAAVEVLTVSHPRRESSATSVGPAFPRVPKIARERVRLGAPPRRPAIEISPTIAKDPKAPSTATRIDCPTESPSAMRLTPRGRPSTEMFAANQTQNSSRGLPVRSRSGTGSIPRCSRAPRAPCSVGSAAAVWPSAAVVDIGVTSWGRGRAGVRRRRGAAGRAARRRGRGGRVR